MNKTIKAITLFSLLVIISSCKKEESTPDEEIHQTTTFKKFTIASNNIQCLEVDSKNNIWIGTKDAVGLVKYNPFTDTWVTYNKSSFGNDIWAILDIDFSSDGTPWIGTNGGVYKYSNNSFSKVLIDSSGLPTSWVKTVHVDHQDRVWASLNDDLYKFENQKWSQLKDFSTLFNYQIQDLKSDSQGNLWIGAFQGLIKFDGSAFKSMDHQSVSSRMNIYNVNVDDEDSLIIGCNGGLYNFSEPNWFTIEPTGFEQPLWDDNRWIVSSIVTNDTSKIYGTWNMGLVIEHKNEFQFLRGSEFQIDSNKFQLDQLKYDNLGNLWMGTRFGEVVVYNPSGLNL